MLCHSTGETAGKARIEPITPLGMIEPGRNSHLNANFLFLAPRASGQVSPGFL